MPDILLEILRSKMERVSQAMQRASLQQVQTAAAKRIQTRSFAEALRANEVNIIAEIKKASPSKGVIRADFDPVAIAREYAENGAAAISVLTEQDYFQGSLEYLKAIRASLPMMPLLRKDFIFDPYQVYESAAAGADALLLIVAMLNDQTLGDLLKLTNEIGIDALVEVHDEDEMQRAIADGAKIIGVNNRNLKTFVTTLETSIRLSSLAPKNALLISESGIETPDDIEKLRNVGYHAFLVGESLMRAKSPGEALGNLLNRSFTV
ncbi:MAG TPA: indole-3-glycerol phosphate synthase TrpC [Blastocatellia bacterium]|nr:indole-3-glycerol phosphate synthase TrpC [Blastocatellia bacterium]